MVGAEEKKRELVSFLQDTGSLLVAFSGGVDSVFLLAMAHKVLGESVVAATANSIIHPVHEIEDARNFTRERGIRHIVFKSKEMDFPDFVNNPPDRCYHCKRLMAQSLADIAEKEGIAHIAHGANADDLDDYRPGFRAAKEAGMLAPLLEAGLSKNEIRFLSKEMGLTSWNKKPSPCLATRISYNSLITEEKLKMIGEAEQFLMRHGFDQIRVRYHDAVARIEVDGDDMEKLMEKGLRKAIVEKFHEEGFEHVTVDLEGYISGKMNRGLEKTYPFGPLK